MSATAQPATDTPRLLIVDDKESMRALLHAAFSDHGYSITTAADGVEAIEQIRRTDFDVIITDLKMPGKDGLEVLKAARSLSRGAEVIVITAFGAIETAVEAMRLGAHDFISKPFQLAEIEQKVERILGGRYGAAASTESKSATPPQRPIVGGSRHTRDLLRFIEKIGPSKSSVLITGPTGTGKELVARALHDASPLRDKPFVPLNCAALAPGVLESELFGHEKGAFTGANARRIGRFEQANGGTLFLDEVGDIDLGVQTKLLRVLQEGEIERVGGTGTISVDARIVAATNRDLRSAIASGGFREDFYYRLNVFSIDVKPLRDRAEDIPGLAEHFIALFSEHTGKHVGGVNDGVRDALAKYSWPGNVRELENVIERAVVLVEGPVITLNDLPPDLAYAPATAAPSSTSISTTSIPAPKPASLSEETDNLECDRIRGALEKFRWNRTKAADYLGIKRTTLQYKIKKLAIE